MLGIVFLVSRGQTRVTLFPYTTLFRAAAVVGLGYRIFLVRQYLAVDIILPYVAWISLLAVIIDLALLTWSRTAFRWAHAPGGRR